METVLPNALHSIRPLLNTATNATPHELFFNFNRRSRSKRSLPAWLSTQDPVMLLKFLRYHKNDDLVEEVQLLDSNPQYANIRYRDGRERSVFLSDLSPCPQGLNSCETESRFFILNEEDLQTPSEQQGKDDLLRTTLLKSTMQKQNGDAPFLNTNIRCNRTNTTLFSRPLPNQLCADRLGQLRVFHIFDMENRFLIKRKRLLCNCNCAWSSPKHIFALNFCTVCSISLAVAAERCQSDARLFRCVVLKLCCLFLC